MQGKRNIISLEREISILRKLNHQNIIKLHEVYENELYIHLVLEYLEGGELLTHIKKIGLYSEKDACCAIKCVLEALDYCHTRNIMHRDLKPENLIIT